ncbi:MAG TPA: MazG nucleotide pyrophosphohydrolase domain-containing protein [Armatimonadota bacterium]|nr:MazG nucleotide pyrophosphohydrolase domain-containing protein [Armatimonadota bacterium]
MTIEQFQRTIDATYGERDAARGLEGTFMWLVEEVGELARALRDGDQAEREGEFADVLAWLSTTATIAGVDLQRAAHRYADGCPKCGGIPCGCERGRGT